VGLTILIKWGNIFVQINNYIIYLSDSGGASIYFYSHVPLFQVYKRLVKVEHGPGSETRCHYYKNIMPPHSEHPQPHINIDLNKIYTL